jgi:hypothetical protein
MVTWSSNAEKRSMPQAAEPLQLAVHGPSVELHCDLPEMQASIARFFSPFIVNEVPAGMGVIRGCIRRYDQAEVVRRLPTSAQALHRPGDLTEIYAHEDRYWTIDDRWGMSEINVLRGQWQSWVVAHPRIDAMRLFEGAVMWPLAQLLKNRGIHLIPAAAAARGPLAVRLLSPVCLGPELAALLAGGFRLIGQRWTCLREEHNHLELLHVPGAVERQAAAPFGQMASEWEDLTTHVPDSSQRHAFCGAVMIVESGRRPRAHLKVVNPDDAGTLLRRLWPIPELHPQRRHGQFPMRIAQLCQCFQLQFSREPRDILALINSLDQAPASAG